MGEAQELKKLKHLHLYVTRHVPWHTSEFLSDRGNKTMGIAGKIEKKRKEEKNKGKKLSIGIK